MKGFLKKIKPKNVIHMVFNPQILNHFLPVFDAVNQNICFFHFKIENKIK